ncbi:TrlF family AAA-like ATPase [Chryseobacterium viscerum]|uniref:Polymerase/histidinol phosphatase N-terminal domain-containing protein n=1 Tax=Chryseobacterium viscerum TaxID=1037377 RepID=A0A316WHC9_9FLAO|nr:hypothetical protein [Chryseobacterium viscerum]PWN59783.1 hypothetical protein C1634_017315 [Chryseobacterium viscerum]
MTINRGSEWRKWDLHLHTPASYDYKDKSITNSEIIEEFKKNDLAVVAITDHHIIDTKRIIELQKLGSEKNISIFPGIEFLSDSRGEEPIHFIAIFGEDCNLEFIWKQIESRTNISRIQGEGKAYNEVYCNILETANLIKELGGILTIHAGKKTNGIENITHSLPHGIAQKEDIAKAIDIFEMGKEADCEGYESKVIPYLIKKINKHIPLIICSDNHKITDYIIKQNLWIKAQPTFEGLKQIIYEPTERVKIQKEEPDSNKLDQLIIDQVKFSSYIKHFWRNKDEKKEIEISNLENIILKIQESIDSNLLSEEEKKQNSDFLNLEVEDKFKEESIGNITFIVEGRKYSYFKFQKFTPKPIYFNKNLNVIIGGKSSGKSILLYNIARTLLNTEKLGKIFIEEGKENEFNFRIKSDANLEPDQNYNFEIKTKVPNISQTRFDYNGNSILSEVIYIPQNYLIKLAEPEYYKKGESLNKLIRNLIVEKEEFRAMYDDIFIARVKKNDETRKTLIRSYFETKETIDMLIVNLGGKGNKEDIEKVLKHNEGKILELKEKTGLDKEQIESYQIKQKELEKIEKDESDLQNDKLAIKEFNRNSISTLKTLVEDIENLEIKTPQIKIDFIKQYEELKTILSSIEIYDNNIDRENHIFQNQLKFIKTEKIKKEDELKPYKQNEETEKQIKLYEDSNKTESQKLNSIIEDEKNIEQKRKDLLKIKKQIFKLYKETYLEYEDVINLLKPRTESFKEENLEIKGKVKFNFPKLEKSMWDISHGKSKSYDDWNIFDKNLKATSSYPLKNFINDIQSIFESIDNGSYKLRSSFSKEYAIDILLDDYFYDYWEVTYKGDKIGSMSTGKASFVILMIIIGLSESPSPILIDQPEDNLDNRSISDDLVKYLKKKKTERQIILVTHNANIAVNADAENIIVASQKGQSDRDNSDCPYQFDYINGALEDIKPLNENIKSLLPNMSIREHIKDILEGGEIAFKKREEKYGF